MRSLIAYFLFAVERFHIGHECAEVSLNAQPVIPYLILLGRFQPILASQ